MAVRIGSARIDERGGATGGKAGDQTGKELSTQDWYLHSKGWRVFRCKDARKADMIANDMRWACANKHIGYDQGQRETLYAAAKPHKFDCAEVTVNCETDCSALVRVCCAYAGIALPVMNTTTEPNVLLHSGAFVELTDKKYTTKATYLRKGDILCTKKKGHTVVVLTDGPLAEQTVPSAQVECDLGDRILRNGDSGQDVRVLQESLISLGYDCGRWGPDGDFGDATEIALKSFQLTHDLDPDGVFGPLTCEALEKAMREESEDPLRVEIVGGRCNVREAPNLQGRIMGAVTPGTVLPFDGQVTDDGWLLIQYKGKNGWVSGKYGRLIE